MNPGVTTVVVAHARPLALRRLLASLEAAQRLANATCPVVVSIDGTNAEVIAEARSFKARAPAQLQVNIVVHEQGLGLRKHVLWCGDLTKEFGPILVLEDDLVVSPAAFPSIQGLLPAA